jgi:hypothetical protein
MVAGHISHIGCTALLSEHSVSSVSCMPVQEGGELSRAQCHSFIKGLLQLAPVSLTSRFDARLAFFYAAGVPVPALVFLCKHIPCVVAVLAPFLATHLASGGHGAHIAVEWSQLLLYCLCKEVGALWLAGARGGGQ